MKKELLKGINRIVVHGNCPDGLASAIILHDVFPNASVEFVLHNTEPYNNLKATEGMIFCDIIPPPDRIDEFIDVGAIVLDHHVSAKDVVAKFGKLGVYADEDKEPGISGAMLAYKEVWKTFDVLSPSIEDPDVSYFAKLAGIRDTWQDQDELWIMANYQTRALMFYSTDHWLDRPSLTRFMTENDYVLGKTLYEKRLRKARKISKNCHKYDHLGYKIAVFNDADKITSDVADILTTEGINIIAGFYFVELDKYTNFPKIVYSLRSDGSVDVSALAKGLNGGGHSRAAGFSWPVQEDSPNPFSLIKEKIVKFIEGIRDDSAV